jgi:hypothetical protein
MQVPYFRPYTGHPSFPSLFWALSIYSRSSLPVSQLLPESFTTTTSYSYMLRLHHSTTHKNVFRIHTFMKQVTNKHFLGMGCISKLRITNIPQSDSHGFGCGTLYTARARCGMVARAGRLPEATGFRQGWGIEASHTWMQSQHFSQLLLPFCSHHCIATVFIPM